MPKEFLWERKGKLVKDFKNSCEIYLLKIELENKSKSNTLEIAPLARCGG